MTQMHRPEMVPVRVALLGEEYRSRLVCLLMNLRAHGWILLFRMLFKAQKLTNSLSCLLWTQKEPVMMKSK